MVEVNPSLEPLQADAAEELHIRIHYRCNGSDKASESTTRPFARGDVYPDGALRFCMLSRSSSDLSSPVSLQFVVGAGP